MDPNTKLILDEMNKRLTELDTKLEQHFINSQSERNVRLSYLEEAEVAFKEWKPCADVTSEALSD